jgi:hypothetical protein
MVIYYAPRVVSYAPNIFIIQATVFGIAFILVKLHQPSLIFLYKADYRWSTLP